MRLPLFFISDIHLTLTNSDKEKARQEKLYRFLRHVYAQDGSLFIVGDLFDFYFEYPHLIPKMYFNFYHELYNLKQKGLDIHYLVGNHDFWVLNFITETLTSHTHLHDFSFEIVDKNFYLTHGDGILSWDRGYRLLKATIRNPLFIWIYRWLHPTIGYNFAHWVSRRGHHNDHSQEYNLRVQQELERYASTLTEKGFDYVITGHYHQTKDLKLEKGHLIILGDWIHNSPYGYFDGQEFTLRQWEHDA